jgi:hypothetical protein
MRVSIERSIIKVLAYFDLFNYPVSKEEIHYFLDQKVSEAEIAAVLKGLTESGLLFKLDIFYSLQNDSRLLARRVNGNDQAQQLLITGYKISRFLYKFPFVRGVGISGSLSKNFADANSDIDFFIITKANRLWLARSLMVTFRKLAVLMGRKDWFCLNYYIDEEALQIPEHNIFIATELITLLPVYGNGTMHKFFHANDWAVSYFPNYINKIENCNSRNIRSWFKNAVEFLLDNRLGDKLDRTAMKLITGWWKKKKLDKKLNKRGIKMQIKTSRHYVKPDPGLFQENVVKAYHKKVKDIEFRWSVYSD